MNTSDATTTQMKKYLAGNQAVQIIHC